MAKRIVVEFICDVCARIASFEAMSASFAGKVANMTVQPPVGWRTVRNQGSTIDVIDVCPDCPIPERRPLG